jgi:hypothetical protein
MFIITKIKKIEYNRFDKTERVLNAEGLKNNFHSNNEIPEEN